MLRKNVNDNCHCILLETIYPRLQTLHAIHLNLNRLQVDKMINNKHTTQKQQT